MTAKVAVIGAGIAGLACARELHAAGHTVTVVDKGKSVGGRLGTRRLPRVAFDQGAQYVSARDPAFAAYLDLALTAGVVARWMPRPLDAATERAIHGRWLVGVPGMNALARSMATGLDVRQQVSVAAIEHRGRNWSLISTSGDVIGPFDALVIAIPAPQALDLCEDFETIVARLEPVVMTPCWSVMLAFADPLDCEFDVSRPDGCAFDWLARDSSKPGRSSSADTWVIHATARFSAEHAHASEQDVCDALHDAFRTFTGVKTAPRLVAAHEWRYARVVRPLGSPCVWESDVALGACGDWCIDARVEAAWISGRELAARICRDEAARGMLTAGAPSRPPR